MSQPDINLEDPQTSLATIDQAMLDHEAAQVPRGHLGMSAIGGKDERTLWLRFRWSLPDDFPAKTLRIFRLGHILEDEIVALLKLSGFEIYADNGQGQQFNFKYLGGHFAGSMDGCIKNVPEAPTEWHVFEAKSANTKKVNELLDLLEKYGDDHNLVLKKWNIDYYGQAQCYMGATGMKFNFFVVYGKDDSRLVILRITPEDMYWEKAQGKAHRIITSDSPAASTFPNKNWYEIKKFKSEHYQQVYWGEALPPKANCRNCRYGCPIVDDSQDAKWVCSKTNGQLTTPQQWQGCVFHNWLPALVPAEHIKHLPEWDATLYKCEDGTEFYNAPETPEGHGINAFSSSELAEISKEGLSQESLSDPFTSAMREEFGGRVVEVVPEGYLNEA